MRRTHRPINHASTATAIPKGRSIILRLRATASVLVVGAALGACGNSTADSGSTSSINEASSSTTSAMETTTSEPGSDETTTTSAGADETTTTDGVASTGSTHDMDTTTSDSMGTASTDTTMADSTASACDLLTAEEFGYVMSKTVTATADNEGQPGCGYFESGAELAKLVVTNGMSAEMAVTSYDPSEFEVVDGIGEKLVVSSSGRQANMLVGTEGYTLTSLIPGTFTKDNLTELMRNIVAG